MKYKTKVAFIQAATCVMRMGRYVYRSGLVQVQTSTGSDHTGQYCIHGAANGGCPPLPCHWRGGMDLHSFQGPLPPSHIIKDSTSTDQRRLLCIVSATGFGVFDINHKLLDLVPESARLIATPCTPSSKRSHLCLHHRLQCVCNGALRRRKFHNCFASGRPSE